MLNSRKKPSIIRTLVWLGAAFVTTNAALADSVASQPVRVEPGFAQNFHQASADNEHTADYRVHHYAQRDTKALRLFVFSRHPSPAENSPAILLFHSGGWTRGRPEWLFSLAKQLAQQGLTAIPVEYRLSQGTTTPVDALIDACDAFRWVRQHANSLHIDPTRLAGWGASAGGQLVSATATAGCPETDSPISGAANALVLISPGIDTQNSAQFRRLIGDKYSVEDFSPIAHLDAASPPTLIIAGEKDTVTPATRAQDYCHAARAAGSDCQLIIYPGLGHLLSRDLDDQRTHVDPDPIIEQQAYQKQEHFLRDLGYLPPPRP